MGSILAADACEAAAEPPPLSAEAASQPAALLPSEASVANPVDMLGSATAATYEAALPLLLEDPAVDAVLVLFVPLVTATADEVAVAVARVEVGGEARARGRDGRPWDPDRARAGRPRRVRVSGVGGPSTRSRCRARGMAPAARRIRSARRGNRPRRRSGGRRRCAGSRGFVPGSTAASYRRTGCRSSRSRPSEHRRVARAASELGFPVVVKTAAAGAHKTETGGVVLDLQDEDEVREAAAGIGGPVVVQLMEAERRASPVSSMTRSFVLLVALGPGGVMAELIGDAGIRIAPPRTSTRASSCWKGRLARSSAAAGSRPPTQTR